MEELEYGFPKGARRIPYGLMNFADVRDSNCYYVDKTWFIPKIEASNRFFFFIRPRRFGKSLTLSMLAHYYDVLHKDKFEKWYGGLYIGDHPTEERNTYLIVRLNFAVVNAEIKSYRASLDAHCDTMFTFFCDMYKDYLPGGTREELKTKQGAVEQLNFLCQQCTRAGRYMYLFIDEYDHFTNKILSEPGCLDDYMSETHGTGYLRSFFDTIKAGTDTAIKRCFVTGVSPVTMDDLTSGFNIGTNYSLSPEFNEMTGFTEEEVRDMLTYYSTTTRYNHTVDELIEKMKPWYDNYCFAEESYGLTTMYNSNMVLYFIDNYLRGRCRIPKNMVEDNIRVDYNKLRMLIRRDKEFVHDASVIQTLMQQGFITGKLKPGFPAESITNPDNFVSLLYYFGMLTIDGTYKGKTKFVIPNEVVREQLYSYLLETYQENDLSFDSYEKSELASGLAYDGEWRPYFDFIADSLRRYASQRDRQKGESFVHGFTLAMTCQNQFYRAVSEKDCQGGYVDIFLHPMLDIYSDMEHSYVVELKYARSTDTDAVVEKLRQEAIEQARRYAASELVQHDKGTTSLHCIVVVYRGMEMVVCEEV